MGDYLPYLQATEPLSGVTCSAAVTGGQLIEVTGVNTVGPAGANSVKSIGVAAHDAAIGAGLTYHPLGGGNVHETVSTAGSTAGDRLACAAAGAVATVVAATGAAAGTDIGIALNTAAALAKVRWIGH